MTLQEAINLSHDVAENEFNSLTPLERKALRLGIEAMKAVINARANNYYTPIQPLPGETLE